MSQATFVSPFCPRDHFPSLTLSWDLPTHIHHPLYPPTALGDNEIVIHSSS